MIAVTRTSEHARFDMGDRRHRAAVGVGEKTKVFGFYTTGDIGGTAESNDYLAIGLEHNF